MVWPIILAGARAYAPYVVFPFAVAVGTLGYMIETRFREKRKWQANPPSTLEERGDRILQASQDPTEVQSLEYRKSVPKTIFDKNATKQETFTGRRIEAQKTGLVSDENAASN